MTSKKNPLEIAGEIFSIYNLNENLALKYFPNYKLRAFYPITFQRYNFPISANTPEEIFKYLDTQLLVKASNDDVLIVLSGSGNSENIIKAIKVAKNKDMKIFGILGFDGGKVKKIINNYIHFNVNDMQISEDMQLIVMHICMQTLMLEKKSIK